MLKDLAAEAEKLDSHTETSLGEAIYRIAGEHEMEPKELFRTVYRALIGKDRGPRLAGFMLTAGRDRIVQALRSALNR